MSSAETYFDYMSPPGEHTPETLLDLVEKAEKPSVSAAKAAKLDMQEVWADEGTEIEIASNPLSDYLNGITDAVPYFEDIRDLKRMMSAASQRELTETQFQRFRELQLLINPSSAEYMKYADIKSPGNEISPRKSNVRTDHSFLSLLADAEQEKESWKDKVNCQDTDPNYFHPNFNTKLRLSSSAKAAILKTALEICEDCPVKAECDGFNRRASKSHSGVRIYGFKVLGLTSKEVKTLKPIMGKYETRLTTEG